MSSKVHDALCTTYLAEKFGGAFIPKCLDEEAREVYGANPLGVLGYGHDIKERTAR